MANILYLVHRLPYPPNKGDKVRSYHLLKHLLKQHRVFLGTFIDDPEDSAHIPTLQAHCAGLHVARLNPKFAKLRSLNGLLANEALTLRYYRDAGLRDWVDSVCRSERIDACVVFSSAMAQYVDSQRRMPLLIDLVDVDSAKWTQYAPKHRWPMSWIYGREGRLLLNYERQIVSKAARSFLVTEAEVNLFRKLAPECGIRVDAMCNGVDADFFSPSPERSTPFQQDEIPIVFTGAMDYWPNIDAVTWFVAEVLPGLVKHLPPLRFYIVGRSPTPEVLTLAGEHVVVTGTVPDVRPYLQHARAVVAPLRVARGIQNKILEAMAMGRPVVAAAECAGPIDGEPGRDFIVASTAEMFVTAIERLIADTDAADEIGLAARKRVVSSYSWDAHMSRIDPYLQLSTGVSD